MRFPPHVEFDFGNTNACINVHPNNSPQNTSISIRLAPRRDGSCLGGGVSFGVDMAC